jgi:hypothetical protein
MSLRLVSIGGILPKKERALNGAAMANDVIANNVTTGSRRRSAFALSRCYRF